jgi:hypothetical protein
MGYRATVPAADAGIVGRYEGLVVGAAIRDFGTPPLRPVMGSAPAEKLPSEWRVGASYRYAPANLTGGVEHVVTLDRKPQDGAGLEWWPRTFVAVRAGWVSMHDGQAHYTAGATLAVLNGRGFPGNLALDYAYLAGGDGAAQWLSVSSGWGGKR